MFYAFLFVIMFALVPDRSIKKYKMLYGDYWFQMMIKSINL